MGQMENGHFQNFSCCSGHSCPMMGWWMMNGLKPKKEHLLAYSQENQGWKSSDLKFLIWYDLHTESLLNRPFENCK